MAQPFVAEIRMVGFNFAPKGWAMCSGQLLPISQNTALFSLLGTYYGGDGKSTFGLPNLNGSVAMHTTNYSGSSPFGTFDLGQSAGEQTYTLIQTEMPVHTHGLQASAVATHVNSPASAVISSVGRGKPPAFIATTNAQMNVSAVSIYGGSQPHNNMMPFLGMYYVIAMQGIYPPRG